MQGQIRGLGTQVQAVEQQITTSTRGIGNSLNTNAVQVGVWARAFRGAFIGAVAGMVFSTVIGGIGDIVSKGAELIQQSVQYSAAFEMRRNAMTLFTGSMGAARMELASLDKLARDTPGLRMDDAEEGAVRLRALGFEAKTVRDLVVGLAKQKLISGTTDEQAMNRVIVNLQQLRAGSPQVERDIRQMILALPSLSIEINKAFGSIAKFKAELRKDPQAALDKFAESLAKANAPAGGLTNAIGKLEDAWIQAGRDFGEPLLDPLTEDVVSLTKYLYENEASWKSWGQSAADALLGVSEAWRGISQLNTDTGGALSAGVSGAVGQATGWIGTAYNAVSFYGRYLRQLDEQRAAQQAQARFAQQHPEWEGFRQPVYREDLAHSMPTVGPEKFLQQQNEQQLKDRLELTKNFYDSELKIIQQGFATQEKALDRHHRYTIAEERDYATSVLNVRQNQIRKEIALELQTYVLQHDLLADDEKAQIELNRQHRTAREVFNARMFAAEAEWQKRLSDLEAEEYEKRRQAALDFKGLQIDAIRQNFEGQQAELTRGLALGTQTYNTSYRQQIQLTQTAYEQEIRLSREQMKLELAQRGLTAEEIINVKERQAQREQKLAIDNAQTLFEIEQRRIEDQKSLIQQYTDFAVDTINSRATAVSSALNLLFSEQTTGPRMKLLERRLHDTIQAEYEDLNSAIKQAEQIIANIQQLDSGANAIPAQPRQLAQPPGVTTQGGYYVVPDRGGTSVFMPPLDEPALSQIPAPSEIQAASAQVKGDVEAELIYLQEARTRLLAFWKDLRTIYKSFVPTAFGVDEMAIRQVQFQHKQEDEALQRQIDSQAKIVSLTKDERQKEIEQQRLLKLTDDQRLLGIRHLGEEEVVRRNTIEAIREYNKALAEGDATATAELENKAIKSAERNITSLRESIEAIRAASDVVDQTVPLEVDRDNWQAILDMRRQEVLLGDERLIQLSRQTELIKGFVALQAEELNALYRIDAAQLHINQQIVFSKNQSDARVLEFLASQKGITEIMSDAKINLISSAYSGLESVIGRLTKKMGIFGDAIKNLLTDLLKLGLNRVFRSLFGLGESQTGNAGGGGFNLGSLLFGGGRGGGVGGVTIGPGGTGLFNPNAGSGIGGIVDPFTGQTVTPGAAAMLGLNTSFSNAPGLLAPAAGQPTSLLSQIATAGSLGSLGTSIGAGVLAGLPILGGGIGTMLGGQSVPGQILGGIGGVLGGIALTGGLLTAFSGSAIAGAAASMLGPGLTAGILAAAPFAAVIAPALIVGAILLARNARRRQEEKIRAQALTDANGALDKLIADVNADRIDGASALTQADQIRARYLEDMGKLKDGKTRRIALATVRELDARISQLKSAVGAQVARRERLELMVPTFADGGATSSFASSNFRGNPLGYQTGSGSGRSDNMLGYFPTSDSLAWFSPTEYILDAETTRNVGIANLDSMRATKGRSFHDIRQRMPVRRAFGGPTSGSVVSGGGGASMLTGGSSGPVTLELTLNVGISEESFVQIVNASLKDNNGSTEQLAAIVKTLNNSGDNPLARTLAKQIEPLLSGGR